MVDSIRTKRGSGMMHIKELYKDHIIKLGLVVYSGAMKIVSHQGHYNTNGEMGKPSAKG